MAANLPRELRLEKMRQAWALACEGRTQASIALQLGICPGQVCRYLAQIRSASSRELVDEAKTYMVLSLRQADKVLDEAFRAFERSTGPKRKATKKTGSPSAAGTGKAAPSDGAGQTTTELIEREGDREWLEEVRAAIKLRHDLLDRFLPPPPPPVDPAAATAGGPSVAEALLAAEARDLAYQSQTQTTPAEPTPDPTP